MAISIAFTHNIFKNESNSYPVQTFHIQMYLTVLMV